MTLSLRRSPLALLLIGAAFIAASLLIPWAVYAQSDSTAPTNLTAGIVEGGVALSWDAPAEDAGSVTGYEVLRRQPRQGENTLLVYVADTGSTDTSYTDANANEPGELYVYGVKALRGGEKSGRSNYVNVDIPEAEPEPTPEPTPSAPAQPTGLNAAATHDSVALSWDAPQDQSITGYQILRRSRDGSNYGDGKGAPEFVVIAESASTAATYTDNTVEPETRYVYRVKAVNDRGVSERSSYANAETPAAPASTPEPTPSAPAQPTGLNAAATHDSVALAWDAPQDESITGYQILRRSRDGSNYGDGKGAPEFVVIAESASTSATYTDNTVEPETRYVYRVKAVNDRGVSERSSYANAETPAAPASTPEPTPSRARPADGPERSSDPRLGGAELGRPPGREHHRLPDTAAGTRRTRPRAILHHRGRHRQQRYVLHRQHGGAGDEIRLPGEGGQRPRRERAVPIRRHRDTGGTPIHARADAGAHAGAGRDRSPRQDRASGLGYPRRQTHHHLAHPQRRHHRVPRQLAYRRLKLAPTRRQCLCDRERMGDSRPRTGRDVHRARPRRRRREPRSLERQPRRRHPAAGTDARTDARTDEGAPAGRAPQPEQRRNPRLRFPGLGRPPGRRHHRLPGAARRGRC